MVDVRKQATAGALRCAEHAGAARAEETGSSTRSESVTELNETTARSGLEALLLPQATARKRYRSSWASINLCGGHGEGLRPRFEPGRAGLYLRR